MADSARVGEEVTEYSHLRGEATPPSYVTVGSPRWKVARALDARGRGFTHLVHSVLLNWRDQRMSVSWECTNGRDGSLNAELVAEADVTCRRCLAIHNARNLGAVVNSKRAYTYYARRNSDGLIKIGVSGSPGIRCHGLGLDLLAVELSVGAAGEYGRHILFDDERVEGEYFKPSRRLLAHIESLAATRGDSLNSVGHKIAIARLAEGSSSVDLAGAKRFFDQPILDAHKQIAGSAP